MLKNILIESIIREEGLGQLTDRNIKSLIVSLNALITIILLIVKLRPKDILSN